MLNTEKFSSMLKNKRGDRGLRVIAQEIGGVSASTLSRIEQGNLPDVETFIRICKWLGVSTEEFTVKTDSEVQESSKKELLLTQLRADRTLPQETVLALAQMISLAYNNIK